MANANPSRVGQVNTAGNVDALFLKVYSGETITAFEEYNVTMGRTMVRSIDSGISAQFPVLGKTVAEYHTPGTELNGLNVPGNEKIITIDDVLLSHIFIANIDEAKSHFDVRAPYSRAQGMALAKEWDVNVLRTGILNSRQSATVTGGNGGTKITSATSKTDATALVAACFAAAQAMDEKDVPAEGRVIYLKPAQYYLLVNSGLSVINRDFSSDNGDVGRGNIFRVAGLEIVKTNNLPTTNVVTGPTKYQGNFSTTTALVQHSSAVGTVKLRDLQTESEYQIQRQGTLMVAKYLVGHGGLRPEASVEIATA